MSSSQGWQLARVSWWPTIHSERRARVRATFMRRTSAKKPTLPPPPAACALQGRRGAGRGGEGGCVCVCVGGGGGLGLQRQPLTAGKHAATPGAAAAPALATRPPPAMCRAPDAAEDDHIRLAPLKSVDRSKLHAVQCSTAATLHRGRMQRWLAEVEVRRSTRLCWPATPGARCRCRRSGAASAQSVCCCQSPACWKVRRSSPSCAL